ncbi:MAG: REP-associated tyrosine transposase [Luteolibacter sp.]
MKFFNDLADISVGRNRLPHWEQEGSTYFVTYRLADSIPREFTDKWNKERESWMLDHPYPWDEATEAEYHRVFSSEIDRLMDLGHGSCVLRSTEIRAILAASYTKFEGERYVIHSWVVMPNHVHLLVTIASDQSLESLVGSWKKFTARTINKSSERKGKLWQKDYFDRIIRDWTHFSRVANYIRKNPAKANLPDNAYTLWESDLVKRVLK